MDSDQISKYVLEELGFKIRTLEPSIDRKEADFLGVFDNEKYLIEAKLKTDDSKDVKEKENSLASKGEHIHEAKQGRCEKISTIFRKAAKQLRSSAKHHEHDYKIVFILAEGINESVKLDNIIDTLYGRTRILEGKIITPCYFFTYSDLHRRKDDVDAVIACSYKNDNLIFHFCLNPFSDFYDSLKISSFSKKWKKAVLDPVEDEKNGLCYLPDEDFEGPFLDKKNILQPSRPILMHIQQKYKTGFIIPIDFDSPEITVRK